VGGADLQAVEAVGNPGGELGLDTLDGLTSLVDNSLVRSVEVPDGEFRFGMLETIREYGLLRLSESGEEPGIRHRHAEHWIEVTEQAAEALAGPEQAAWTRQLERDHDNFRSALGWVVQTGEAELGLRLVAALHDFWRLGSHVQEGVRWIGELLALPGAAGTLLRARALTAAGDLYAWIDDPEAYLRIAEEALAIYRDLGVADSYPEAIAQMGWAQLQVGRPDVARPRLEEARALHLRLGERFQAASCTMGLGVMAVLDHDPTRARPLFEDAQKTFKDLHNTYYVALVEVMASDVDRLEGRFDAVEQRLRTGLAAFRQVDSLMGIAWTLYVFANLAVLRGQHERAVRLVGASDALLERVGEMPSLVTANVGDVGEPPDRSSTGTRPRASIRKDSRWDSRTRWHTPFNRKRDPGLNDRKGPSMAAYGGRSGGWSGVTELVVAKAPSSAGIESSMIIPLIIPTIRLPPTGPDQIESAPT
jgi:tetratricopeptide (TPR) repeat protein